MKKNVMLLTVAVLLICVGSNVLAGGEVYPVPVPDGTKFTHQKNADESFSVTVTGPIITEVRIYYHDGRRNGVLGPKDIGGTNQGGPYVITLDHKNIPTGYTLYGGDGMNFKHKVIVTDDSGACEEVERYSLITGYDFAAGNIPLWSDFDPNAKTGVVAIAIMHNGEPGAEYRIFEKLSPAVQEAFLRMHFGVKDERGNIKYPIYPRIVVP